MVLLALFFAVKELLTGHRLHRKNKGTFEANYHVLERISENSDSEVRVLKVRRFSDGQVFCAKLFYKNAQIKRGVANEQNEIRYLKMLAHTNVVQLEEYFDEPERIVIIIEYLEMNMYEVLKTYKRIDEEAQVRIIAKSIFSLLAHLASHDIVHGDIVLQNFMLKHETDSFESIKIVDFNTCDTQQNRLTCNRIQSQQQFLSSQPSSIAPETITQYEISCKSDVWGAGIMIYTLIFGTVPFNGKNADEIYQNILQKQVSFEVIEEEENNLSKNNAITVSPLCQDFLQRVLNKDPRQRLSASEVLSHPWLVFNQSQQQQQLQ